MKRIKVLGLGLLSLVSIASCTKEPGVGGSGTISGKIYIENRNSLGTLVGEYYAQDYDVFLIYGDTDNAVDDDAKTSYDGSFEFKYLNKGKYKLFVYSAFSANCATCQPGEDSVIKTSFEITEKNQTINLKDIIVYK